MASCNVHLNINQAIPCGLIINELISNSLKYAFPDNRNGEIFVKLYSRDDNFYLEIGDTGKGFPKDLDFKKTESLGLQIVTTLVDQLNGYIKMVKKLGTVFSIRFPKN